MWRIEYSGDEGNHEVDAWFSPGVEDGSSSFVDSNVSAVDDVEGSGGP